jgi:hypothetical protein
VPGSIGFFCLVLGLLSVFVLGVLRVSFVVFGFVLGMACALDRGYYL